MNWFPERMIPHVGALLTAILFASPAMAEEPTREGGWLITRDPQSRVNVHTMEMTLHPKPEPRPALQYRLIPDDFDMLDGNSAIFYLMAMGFMEQDPARKRLHEIEEQAEVQARKKEVSPQSLPPASWQSMAPEELPLDEVKKYLRLTSFQKRYLAKANRQRWFDMDRNLRDADNPLAFLIPEIQSMRSLARMQSLRCKTAIAEGRIAEAIEILGQQYTMARHVAQDDFLVSNLVGAACAGISWDNALYLVQHADTPNLYWAFASIPRPVIDVTHSLAMERQLLYLQMKTLSEVDETPRPAGYWQDFIGRLIPELRGFERDLGLPNVGDNPADVRTALVAYIAAAYPSARRYLTEDRGMDPQQVEAYPTAQTVFLAIVRYYDEARDGYFKWSHLPFWQSEAATRGFRFDEFVPISVDRAGWIAAPAAMLLPAISAVHRATARIDQQVALVQTVEAIRMYGANHGGKLPPSLDALPVPAPPEPFTGKPLDYRFHDDHAVLTGHEMPGLQYRLVLRFATDSK